MFCFSFLFLYLLYLILSLLSNSILLSFLFRKMQYSPLLHSQSCSYLLSSVSFFTLSLFMTPSFSSAPFFLCEVCTEYSDTCDFFSLSFFLFLSSYCGEDCRAISVGSDVTWKMHCPRALDRIICIRGVCISTAAYMGTVYIR